MGIAASRALLACLVLAGAADGREEDPKVGLRVVTKYRQPLRLGRRVVDRDETFRVYTVKAVQGNYIWIAAGDARGWVSTSAVVPFEDAVDFYTEEIRANPY